MITTQRKENKTKAIAKRLFSKKLGTELDDIKRIMQINENLKDAKDGVWIISDSSSSFSQQNLIKNG
jgi:hypothetical protein